MQELAVPVMLSDGRKDYGDFQSLKIPESAARGEMLGLVSFEGPAPVSVEPTTTRIYFYLHVYSVSNISASEQSFNAYFYFRATWVERTHNGLEKNPSSADPFERLGVRKPPIIFANSLRDEDVSDRTVERSKYRRYRVNVETRKDIDRDDSGGRVIEWKEFVRGTFRYKFEPRMFPNDHQLLTIEMSATQIGWRLCEDRYHNCASVFRDDLHCELEYAATSKKISFQKAKPFTSQNRKHSFLQPHGGRPRSEEERVALLARHRCAVRLRRPRRVSCLLHPAKQLVPAHQPHAHPHIASHALPSS